MEKFFRLVGPERAVELFGVRLIGFSAETLTKLVLTLIFVGLVLLLGSFARWIANRILNRDREQARFWAHQSIKLATAVLMTLSLLSIWFEDPTRLATALGLVTAGLAFALQKVVQPWRATLSAMPRCLTMRSATTVATSRVSGKNSHCPSHTLPIGSALNASYWRSQSATRFELAM